MQNIEFRVHTKKSLQEEKTHLFLGQLKLIKQIPSTAKNDCKLQSTIFSYTLPWLSQEEKTFW